MEVAVAVNDKGAVFLGKVLEYSLFDGMLGAEATQAYGLRGRSGA